jgi:uracil-DNA glycosylase
MAGLALPDNRLQRPLADCLDQVPASWAAPVEAWRRSPPGQGLQDFLARRQAAGAVIYPAEPLRALALTPLDAVHVVILGQDPYHGPGQAEGLAFSVPEGCRRPPSLRNIDIELERDLGIVSTHSNSLVPWAERGVLLLNTTLTVEDGAPASHARRGWEALTDGLIAAVAAAPQPKVFLLWGGHAQAKVALIDATVGGPRLVLQANHPSPLSARRPPVPFIGCGHFGQAQRWLAGRCVALQWQR